jgi:hypothetical protein
MLDETTPRDPTSRDQRKRLKGTPVQSEARPFGSGEEPTNASADKRARSVPTIRDPRQSRAQRKRPTSGAHNCLLMLYPSNRTLAVRQRSTPDFHLLTSGAHNCLLMLHPSNRTVTVRERSTPDFHLLTFGAHNCLLMLYPSNRTVTVRERLHNPYRPREGRTCILTSEFWILNSSSQFWLLNSSSQFWLLNSSSPRFRTVRRQNGII